MNYIAYGNKKNKSLLFIHGLASTSKLCFESLLPYLQDYYIVLCELDRHCAFKPNDMLSLKDSINDTVFARVPERICSKAENIFARINLEKLSALLPNVADFDIHSGSYRIIF